MRIEMVLPSPHGHQAQKIKAFSVRIGGKKQLPRPEPTKMTIDLPHDIRCVTNIGAVPCNA